MANRKRESRLNGLFPLSYMGVIPVAPQNFIRDNRPPTTTDSQNFYIGDMWLDDSSDTALNNYVPPTISNLWILVSLDKHVATWINFGGAVVVAVTGLRGDNGNVATPTAGIINVLGTFGANITTLATAGPNTITVGISGTTNHAVQIGNATGSLTSITSIGTAGQVLTSNGAGVDPSWQTPGAGTGTVTSVTGGNNITITGTPTIAPIVNVSGTTNHSVQIGNSTGSLTSIAVGTTGQVLTAQTGADPIWGPSTAGALVLIQTQTAAAVATLAFTTGITNTYNNYLMLIDSVNCPTASSDALYIQLSTDGGATWISTNYLAGSATPIGLSTGVTNLPNGTSHLAAATTITNVTVASGFILTTGTNCYYDTSVVQSVGVNNALGVYTVAGTVANAFRIIVDGAKVFSGNFSLYGYVK